MLSNISITIFNQRKITTLSKCALVRLMKGYIFLLYRSIRHGFTCVMEHVYIYIHASGVAIINQTFLKITEKLRSTPLVRRQRRMNFWFDVCPRCPAGGCTIGRDFHSSSSSSSTSSLSRIMDRVNGKNNENTSTSHGLSYAREIYATYIRAKSGARFHGGRYVLHKQSSINYRPWADVSNVNHRDVITKQPCINCNFDCICPITLLVIARK